MARVVFTTALIVSLVALIGCQTGGGALIVPVPTSDSLRSYDPVNLNEVTEVDLVEQMVNNRQAYRAGLELLIKYYTKIGNNEKILWAKKELNAFDAIPKYKYITESDYFPPGLKATTLIPEADVLYNEAKQLEDKAKPFGLPVAKDENTLRLALDKYNQLIAKYPSSDKIDDAAFQAGGICEYFKDYSFALPYYQNAYTWDPETPYPARFKRAAILDRHLSRRMEALALYREAIREESEFKQWVEFAQKRIMELTRSEEAPR